MTDLKDSRTIRRAGELMHANPNSTYFQRSWLNSSSGLLERFHVTRHYLAYDNNVTSTARYSHHAGQQLDESVLFPALHQVIKAHGALTVRLSGDSGNDPTFKRLLSVDLTKIVYYSDQGAESLPQIIEAQFVKRIDTSSELPLWRLTVLKDNTTIFSWHHGIGDGISSLAFHQSLLAALNADNASYHGLTSVDISPIASLTPEVEQLVNMRPSISQFYRAIFDTFAPVSWTRKMYAWSGKDVKLSGLESRLRVLEISPADNAKFIAICKKNKATITPTLETLAVSIISQLLLDDTHATKSKSWGTISTVIPMSLRPISNVPESVFCNHFSSYHAYPPISPEFSWATASNLTSTLHAFRSKAPGEVGMLKFIFGQYENLFKGKIGKKRDVGLEVSNIGKFVALANTEGDSSKENWIIDRLIFAQSDVIVGAAIKLNVVGTPAGGLTIAVTWGPETVDDAFAEAFVSMFIGAFHVLAVEKQ